MSDGLSNRAAGKLAGCSHVAIAKAIEHGHLATLPDGKISPEALDKWNAGRRSARGGNSKPVTTQQVTKAGKPERVAMARLAKVAAIVDDIGEGATGEEVEAALTKHGIFLSRADAELHRDSYMARIRQLEYEQKAAKVIEVEHVAKIVGDSLARVRTRLLAIPAEQAPRLHRCKTVNELQDAILECITEALEELVTDAAFAV
jgi:hypothetical protein